MTSYATANDSNTTVATTATMENANVANASTTIASQPSTASVANTSAGAENVDGTRNFHTTIERSLYESPTTPTTYDCDVPLKLGETTLQQQQPQQDQQALDTPTSNCCTDYDCDSFSDGHEKTDTTPENLKKIDDVIEQRQYQQQLKNRSSSHYLSNSQAMASSATDCDRDIVGAGSGGYGVGLAVAVDDSNAKICFGKPLCSEKDMLSKSERIESHGRSIDSSTVDLGKIKLSADGNGSDSGCITPSTMSDMNTAALIAGGADNSESLPHDDDSSASNATNTTTTATTNKQSYAFTIDNFNDSGCDPEAAKARYKSMMERFQSRHRRGASMSKLEAGDATNKGTTMTSSISATPLSGNASASARHGRNSGGVADNSFDSGGAGDAPPKVKLRVRDRSTSRVRDASKRHSWSPRSSTQESQLQGHDQHAIAQTPSATRANERSSAIQKPLPPTRKNVSKQKPPPLQLPKGTANLVANRTQFTPRSTAMQLALQKVDFLCAQPPLAELKNYNLEADNISETGTYTLDGDNYTEEQKDLMNIDKSAKQALKAQQRPKNLQLSASVSDAGPQLSNTKIPVHANSRSNVLEVNYYHDTEMDQGPQSPRAYTERDLILGSHESAGAYLEKIKSRVLRNASATRSTVPVHGDIGQKTPTEDDGDLGCFTSVTTSGVLAKQGALDPRPRLTRKSGLSTSQIDSSEYVSNEMKLKANTASAYSGGGFTDHQKAEYRLNLFTNQKDNTQAKFAATRSYIESPPETPPHHKLSDAAVLKTAQTKNDWIQEWARNARARSLASETSKTRIHSDASQAALMTRSYTCASDTAAADSLTDDSIYNNKQCISAAKLNRSLAERYRLSGECDYSSDPTLSSGAYSSSGQLAEGICKPPKSPSKIPSPLHSIGRTRSASRTRAPLQNVLLHGGVGDEESDIYLQKTAAAINNLQQSLSRKNSLKSPPTTHSSASPRAHSARSHAHSSALYSPPDDCGSPQHGLGSPTSAASGSAYHHSPLHRRVAANDPYGRNAQNLQLMTSSFNEQQLKLLTSGEYLSRQMRARKNSFDGNIGNSPARRAAAVAAANAQAQAQAGQSGQESPLRRSSSFSAKIVTTQRAARPQFSNIYTPPAARHNYSLVGGGDGQSAAAVAGSNSSIIKKSASSNNFRQAIGDYDENFQYYINDEDDIGEEYYSSGAEEVEEEEEDNEHYYQHEDDVQAEVGNTSAVPLSNTRLNKALLMRIERSKQRVSGGVSSGASKPSSAPVSKLQQQQGGSCGVMACPNTPELPRRGIRSAPRSGGGAATARQSVPRDTSLSRLASQVPNSLASAKKQLLQTAAAVPSTTKLTNQRVQPKYLDISKYKPVQGNNFLRKNESKSTLKTSTLAGDVMKRSPSSSSMGLSRADPTRTSNRSVRSVASCMTTSGTTLGGGGGGGVGVGRASSAVRRDQSVTKQKEAEMAMWKRRSTYDPMKAAAEDRRKKEEAKRMAITKNIGEMPCESATRTPPPPFKQQLSLDEQWTEYGEEECV
ncbi:uncharacterized protein LOC129242644 [Anastrepha obliqua]|uniref:uncharacterized protein LOC129242644 n=1 Tax=Anastrepha obliqua TaxID=95512 RepID=UPI00240A0B64|nr:uncharacterized protein LOC129242644 [Anastrepha obliqua]XP_054735381.1 uncharacterized protein LOC129242644 [Anastrepha obliqua]XP_054735382.1 uncharacterized protein LOC129242644 [Anastrepha obliqua]XP_054735383.1 uncharacterized protein LOC129242644 [Anastrepha obliqua]XP_054735385.1 uncharacterized protein LOC129242644 [Anastrepha obliqua]